MAHREEIAQIAKDVERSVDQAQSADPRKIEVWYKEQSGLLTPSSQIRWRDAADDCAGKWSAAVAQCRRLRDAERALSTKYDALNRARKELREFRKLEPPSPVEVVHLDDLTHAAKLLAEFCASVSGENDWTP